MAMSTPTKRRKTNAYKSSPQTVGSIDFFFGKQKARSELQEQEGSNNPIEPRAQSQDESTPKLDDLAFTDEKLARKLQSQWDQEEEEINNDASVKLKGTLLNGAYLSLNELKDLPRELNDNSSHHESPSSFTRTVENSGLHAEGKVIVGPEKKATLSLQSTSSAEDTVSSTVPFDANPLAFDPDKYIPTLKNLWAKEGGDASYGLLTRCFILVNSTQSRIKIVDTLVNFLRTIIEGDPQSLLPAVSDCRSIRPLLRDY